MAVRWNARLRVLMNHTLSSRQPLILSVGAAFRVNALDFATLQFDVSRPLQRPGRGWVYQFSLAPGF